MRIAQQYFVASYAESSLAQSYLHEKRKLDPATIAQRGIGYAPDNAYGLPRLLKEK